MQLEHLHLESGLGTMTMCRFKIKTCHVIGTKSITSFHNGKIDGRLQFAESENPWEHHTHSLTHTDAHTRMHARVHTTCRLVYYCGIYIITLTLTGHHPLILGPVSIGSVPFQIKTEGEFFDLGLVAIGVTAENPL